MEMMRHNVGEGDRYLRIMLGAALTAGSAGCFANRNTTAGLLVGLLGGCMLAEGILGSCPVYSLIGMDTVDEPPEAEGPAPGLDVRPDEV